MAFEPGELHARYRGIRKVGSGVGLALVARLAERLGGRAQAGSAPEGGAAFLVVLPDLPGAEGARRGQPAVDPSQGTARRRTHQPSVMAIRTSTVRLAITGCGQPAPRARGPDPPGQRRPGGG